MRLDYVVGREAARRRRTRHASPSLSLSFFSLTVDKMTNRERADVSMVHHDEFVKKSTHVNAILRD